MRHLNHSTWQWVLLALCIGAMAFMRVLPGLPKVTLLSPTSNRLADIYRVWAEELGRLSRKERDRAEPEPATPRGELPSIEALAARVTPTDKAVPNGWSIAMLLEHRGASVMLGADAFFPTVLVPALAALAGRRGIAGPVPIDAVKLSHHGSRANVRRIYGGPSTPSTSSSAPTTPTSSTRTSRRLPGSSSVAGSRRSGSTATRRRAGSRVHRI